MKKEDCEGCLTPDKDEEDNCIWYNKELICPCSICIIKVVCLTYCDPMKKYIDSATTYN